MVKISGHCNNVKYNELRMNLVYCFFILHVVKLKEQINVRSACNFRFATSLIIYIKATEEIANTYCKVGMSVTDTVNVKCNG